MPEVFIKGQVRKFAPQVEGVFFPIDRIVQHAIYVMKNGVFGDGAFWLAFPFFIMSAELNQPPICNVVNFLII